MKDTYWYRLYETPADQGASDEVPAAAEDAQEAPPEETYTRAELAEMLGPRFAERYASAHEGPEAFRQYANSFEETLRHVNRLSHGEQLEDDEYEALGIAPPPQYEEEEQDDAPDPLYGVPWAAPETWDELVELAERNPRAAAEFALNRQDLPDETKAWFFANWASVDAAGAFAYNQAATTEAARQYADQQAAELRAQVEPLVHDRMVANGQLMLNTARDSIPGFADNAQAVSDLLAERQMRNPDYHSWFLNTTLKEQIAELRDLTGIAIFRSQPARDEAAQADLDATDAAKTRTKTETARGGGSRGNGGGVQSAMKQKNIADFQKLKEQGVI